VRITDGSTLTLAADAGIDGGDLEVGVLPQAGGSNGLINLGTIHANDSGKMIRIVSDTLDNQGLLQASGGGQLIVDSELTNSGTINAIGGSIELNNLSGDLGSATLLSAGSSLLTDGTYTINGTLNVGSGTELSLNGSWTNNGLIQMTSGTVNLGGEFSATGVSGFSRSGGEVNLTGIFDNTGSVFTLDSATGPWRLQGGTFRGGTLQLRDGVTLAVTGQETGVLDGIHVDGDVDLMSGTLRSINGSTYGGELRFTDGTLLLEGDHTIDGGSFLFQGGSNEEGVLRVANGASLATLTLGPSTIVSGGSGFLGADPAQPDFDRIVNQGLISATGGPLTIQPNQFVNQGLIEARNGGVLTVDVTGLGSTWTNAGTIGVHSNGTVHLLGEFTTAGLGTLDRAGGRSG